MATARNVARQLSQERGLDIRNPASSILALNSRDRYRGNRAARETPTSPFDCVLSSKQNFMTGYFERIAVTEIDFTWALPTIPFTQVCQMLIFCTAIPPPSIAVITIVPGFYTPTTLAAALQTAVLAQVPQVTGFVCTVNPDPAQPNTFVCSSSAVPFNFISTTSVNLTILDPAVRNKLKGTNPDKTTVFEMMNWEPLPNGTPPAAAYTSGPLNLLWTNHIDVVCSQLTANQEVKDGTSQNNNRDVCVRIYLASDGVDNNIATLGSTPFRIYRQYTFPKQIRYDPLMPIQGYLKFELFDDSGDILYTGQNTGAFANNLQPDWQITLLVSEV